MRIALAGTSHWHAEMHLDAVRECGATVVGVWDESPVQAKNCAAAHAVEVLADFDGVLDARPDLVVLMGHPRAVPSRAEALIEARVPLVLEKPAATRTVVIEGLRDLAHANRAFVSVPLPNRFGPAALEWQLLSRQGRAGALAHAHFRLVNGPPERYAADGVPWVVDPEVGGGGALRNLGIHGVDGALSLATGRLAIRSATIGNRIHRSPVEDYALLVLEDEAGAVFTVEAGYTYAWTKAGGDFEWRIVGGNATLIDQGDRAFCTTLDTNERSELRPEPPETRYQLCMRDTLQRLSDARPPAISIDDYVAAMSLIDAAYERRAA